MVKTFLGMKGKSLNWAISTIAGMDFLLFGYGTFNHLLTQNCSSPPRGPEADQHYRQIRVSWVVF